MDGYWIFFWISLGMVIGYFWRVIEIKWRRKHHSVSVREPEPCIECGGMGKMGSDECDQCGGSGIELGT